MIRKISLLNPLFRGIGIRAFCRISIVALLYVINPSHAFGVTEEDTPLPSLRLAKGLVLGISPKPDNGRVRLKVDSPEVGCEQDLVNGTYEFDTCCPALLRRAGIRIGDKVDFEFQVEGVNLNSATITKLRLAVPNCGLGPSFRVFKGELGGRYSVQMALAVNDDGTAVGCYAYVSHPKTFIYLSGRMSEHGRLILKEFPDKNQNALSTGTFDVAFSPGEKKVEGKWLGLKDQAFDVKLTRIDEEEKVGRYVFNSKGGDEVGEIIVTKIKAKYYCRVNALDQDGKRIVGDGSLNIVEGVGRLSVQGRDLVIQFLGENGLRFGDAHLFDEYPTADTTDDYLPELVWALKYEN